MDSEDGFGLSDERSSGYRASSGKLLEFDINHKVEYLRRTTDAPVRYLLFSLFPFVLDYKNPKALSLLFTVPTFTISRVSLSPWVASTLTIKIFLLRMHTSSRWPELSQRAGEDPLGPRRESSLPVPNP